MATKTFGESQILELRFSRQEVLGIIHENIKARFGGCYDFDLNNPLIVMDGDDTCFRFVQQTIAREPRSESLRWKSLEALKENQTRRKLKNRKP